jgi:hypothetical protein
MFHAVVLGRVLPLSVRLWLAPLSFIQRCVRTLRLKVKREGYAWLNAAAIAPAQQNQSD